MGDPREAHTLDRPTYERQGRRLGPIDTDGEPLTGLEKAALLAQRDVEVFPPDVWHHEAPTEAGWYWVRPHGMSVEWWPIHEALGPFPVRLIERGVGLVIDDRSMPNGHASGGRLARTYPCDWAGPIGEPRDP